VNKKKKTKIKFGTDGWRAIISEDFTFENVSKVAKAIADYLGKGKKVVVGYDTRFLSDTYANLVAQVLSGNGIKVILANYFTPTPVLSYYVKHLKFDGGVLITASHNPAIYNGIKFKESFGGSAIPKTVRKLEKLIKNSKSKKDNKLIIEKDISKPYVNALKKYINKKYIAKKRYKIVIDSMYGAGGYYLEEILKKYGHDVITIHCEPNPNFPDINPEPIKKNLVELSKKVRELKADIGIATDGDADRVGIVDSKGEFVTPHHVLSLLFLHLLTSRKWNGLVVKTISSTVLINKIAKKYNVNLKETSVGFKYIVEWMLKENVLIGGEESGGNGFKNHIPERDGLLSGLLLVEMMGYRKKRIRELIGDLEQEFGKSRYDRIDMHLEQNKIKKLYKKLQKNPPKKIAGISITDIKTFDGVKLILKDNSWLLFRGSGTEPILRLYAESNSNKKVNELLKAAQEIIKKG